MKRNHAHIPDLDSILEAAGSNDLKVFLKKQAKRNLALEIRLRTYLIRHTDDPKGSNKYGHLLGLLIRHNVYGKIRLTKRAMQLLREVCEQFVTLQDALLEEGELGEVWKVADALTSQLQMLMDRYQGPDQGLVHTLGATYAHVQELLRRSPAPELRDTIVQAFWDLIAKDHYTVHDIQHNAVITLAYAIPDVLSREQVLTFVRERCRAAAAAGHPNRKIWLAVALKLPGSHDLPVQHFSEEDLYDIAYQLAASGEQQSLHLLMQSVPRPGKLPEPKALQWARWKFGLALLERNTGQIVPSGIEMLEADHAFSTYRRIRKVTDFDSLRNAVARADIPDILRAQIYADEKEWSMLQQLMKSTGSLEVLVHYCSELAQVSPSFESDVPEVAVTYASHHGGPSCLDLMHDLVRSLYDINRASLAECVIERLQEKFDGRFDTLRDSVTTRREAPEKV